MNKKHPKTSSILIYFALVASITQTFACKHSFYFWWDRSNDLPALAFFWIILSLAGMGVASVNVLLLKRFI